MKRMMLFAGAVGLFLVAASAPQAGKSEGELSSVVAAPAPAAKTAPAATPAPAAKPAPVRQVAEARTTYPRCSATVRDRCVQGRGQAQQPRYARVPERRIQLASRAGERG